MPTDHIVKSGESLSSIAKAHGFHDWHTIYDAPENAALRAKRPNPSLLMVGDKVVIPDKKPKTAPVSSGKPATFKAVLPVPLDPLLELDFLDANEPTTGIPKLAVSYVISSEGKPRTRAVGSNGRVMFTKPDIKEGDTLDILDIRDQAEAPDIRYGEYAIKGLSINTTHIIKFPDKRKIINRIAAKHSMIRRSAWGAVPPKKMEMDQDWDFNMIVIHHSNGRKDPKDIQEFHMNDKKFDDIAYQYLVLPSGTIAEGRYLAHKGASNAEMNTGKIGILVAGDFEPGTFDFTDDIPTPEQIKSTRSLIDSLKSEFSGITRLLGHRDLSDTKCPGELLYKFIPALRTATGLSP